MLIYATTVAAKYFLPISCLLNCCMLMNFVTSTVPTFVYMFSFAVTRLLHVGLVPLDLSFTYISYLPGCAFLAKYSIGPNVFTSLDINPPKLVKLLKHEHVSPLGYN